MKNAKQLIKAIEANTVPTPRLIELYNKLSSKKPIKRFSDRATAKKRVIKLLESHTAPTKRKAKSKKDGISKAPLPPFRTPKSKKPAGKAKRPMPKRPGRKSKYSGWIIKVLVPENPRRVDTHGWRAFNLYKKGMTYEEYMLAGGAQNHLRWDIAHRYIEMVKPS